MDIKNQIELELYFSDHFDTILFPVLADFYLKKNDLKRARKVCDIGFNYHKNDVSGWYIYSQIEKKEGNLKEAETALEHVLLYSKDHLAAAEMLCEVQTVLGRATNRLLKSWQNVLKIDPTNQTASDFVNKFQVKKDKLDNKIIKQKNNYEKSKPINTPVLKSNLIKELAIEKSSTPLNISPKLATFTLVSVLKNQGLFDQALNVLDSLEQKGESVDSINIEREIIKTLIKKSRKV